MSNDQSSLEVQIATLEATLRMPGLPDALRVVAVEHLRALHAQRSTQPPTTGTVEVSDDAIVYGPVVGVNNGTIQTFFGTKPPQDAKELLDNYLESLVATHDALRMGRLLGRQQMGSERRTAPDLSLCAVYTSLSTDARARGDDFALTVAELREVLQQGNPADHLPDALRLLLLRAQALSLGSTSASGRAQR
ncbi:MAG: hypothetical protein RLZZ387_1705 [Chloroflexota bacterium]|jgi:hypothetical protein